MDRWNPQLVAVCNYNCCLPRQLQVFFTCNPPVVFPTCNPSSINNKTVGYYSITNCLISLTLTNGQVFYTYMPTGKPGATTSCYSLSIFTVPLSMSYKAPTIFISPLSSISFRIGLSLRILFIVWRTLLSLTS